MITKRDRNGDTWLLPLTHYDRSRNVLGLSRDDCERMCRLAVDHPALKQSLEDAKMIWMLLDNKRRPDNECLPQKIEKRKP